MDDLLIVESLMTEQELSAYERTIQQGKDAFVSVGRALSKISDGRGYRFTHATFEDYVEQRWGFSVRKGYSLMAASEVVDNVHTRAQIGYSQARAISTLEPDDQRSFVEQHDISDMSSRAVEKAVSEWKQRAEKAERERDEAIAQAVSLDDRANKIREENERLKREKSPEPQTVEKVVHAIPNETKRELELLKENARKWREEAQNAQTKAAQAETEIQQYRETLGELSDAQLRKNQRHAVIDRIKWFRGEVGLRLKQLDVEAQELRTDIEVRREVENCALALNRAASEMREWLEEINPKEVVYDAGTFASG